MAADVEGWNVFVVEGDAAPRDIPEGVHVVVSLTNGVVTAARAL